MAIDEADQSESDGFDGVDESASPSGDTEPEEPISGSDVRVGDYTWREFLEEYGYGDQVSGLYENVRRRQEAVEEEQLGLDSGEEGPPPVPHGDDWQGVAFEPTEYLGFHPDDLTDRIGETAQPAANVLQDLFMDYVDPDTTPVVKDVWTWEHFKWEYYYDDDGSRPRTTDGEIDRFDGEEYLGFEPDHVENELSRAEDIASELLDVVEDRTVNVQDELDEDDFFTTVDGHTTVTNRYDLEKAVPVRKKLHFREIERYWVNKPYSFVIIFHSEKENEKKYYAVEPYLNEIEGDLQEFLSGKLRNAIKYSQEEIQVEGDEGDRRQVIERETRRLLKRYDLFKKSAAKTADMGFIERLKAMFSQGEAPEESDGGLDGITVRPEPAILEDDPDTLNEYQVEKLLYLLKRNFIGYERIDPIKHDINVEDISCDGHNSPVFVYHSEYEQIISNIFHGEAELDDFVVKLAQRSGKGISKRRPQVDATLPDGSRAQLTLGAEVSAHGTNYTIRQFKDVPFTPIDLINWNTFSLDEMAFLWLCIENHKSLIFAGGTASGKTTSLNAVSLFIPSNTKIVSIEDTREVELPQRNWIASVTRQSFTDDAGGGVDEFDLLEAALRQRPDYIVMGEIRGEEGRTLFQVMSTGHTTYTTFHADSVGEVLKRFTTDPINVSKTMFTALDLVSIQTQTRVEGRKVRRNKELTEVNHYDAENDEINVQDVYQWQAETDEFLMMGDSNTLEEIKFDRGWNQEKLDSELFKRRVIIAYLITKGLNEYTQVAATFQAFINDPDTILTLIANGQLEESLEDLREMESVLIDIDPEKEELVPRPDPPDEIYNEATDILERAEESLFDEYRGKVPAGLAESLSGVQQAENPEIDAGDDDEFDFGGEFADDIEGEFGVDDTFGGATGEEEVADEGPDWLSDEGGFSFGEDDDGGDATATAEASTSEASADASAGGATADAAGADGADADAPAEPAAADDRPPELEATADSAGTEEPAASAGTTGPPDTVDSTPNASGEPASETEPPAATPDAGSSAQAAGGGDAESPPVGGEGEEDPIFSEPDEGDSFFGDDDQFFDEEESESIFSDDAEEGALFSDSGEEEEFFSTADSGGGMFGTDGAETGKDLLEEAGDLFGGGGDDADASTEQRDADAEDPVGAENTADQAGDADEATETPDSSTAGPGDAEATEPSTDSTAERSAGDATEDGEDGDGSESVASDAESTPDVVDEPAASETPEDETAAARDATRSEVDETDGETASPSGDGEETADAGETVEETEAASDDTEETVFGADDAGDGTAAASDDEDGGIFSSDDDEDATEDDGGGGIFSSDDGDDADDTGDGGLFDDADEDEDGDDGSIFSDPDDDGETE
jgi:flagellar protein FlaI